MPALLIWTESWGRLLGDGLDDRFDVIRLWEVDDPEAELARRGASVVATLTTSLSAADLDRLPNLRVIAVPGAGYDGIDVAAARARGITVANAGDAHSGEVADHAVALTLGALHRVVDASVRDGRWARSGTPGLRRSLATHRFGIVGLGNIGTAIATRLAPFGGEIAWWSPRPREAPWPRRDSLLDLAQWCSVLVVAARGDLTGLIDAAVIDAVGPDGLIVNISRGAVVDEDALIAALREGRLGQAALDVFAAEPTDPQRWRDVPDTLFSPHAAGLTDVAAARLREAAIRNLASALDGGPVVNAVG